MYPKYFNILCLDILCYFKSSTFCVKVGGNGQSETFPAYPETFSMKVSPISPVSRTCHLCELIVLWSLPIPLFTFLTADRNTNAIVIIQQSFSIGAVASLNKHRCVILGGGDVLNDFSARLENKQKCVRGRNLPGASRHLIPKEMPTPSLPWHFSNDGPLL